MRKSRVELWAVQVLERIARDAQAEDHHVELKGEWIDPRQAARRLAGHANSAPDEHVLWVIGVDERTGEVRGAREQELSEWWRQVEAEFADGVAPEMTAVGMRWNNTPIVVIAFSTDRAPYVVRNPEFGATKGHNIAWEVPMRVGTGVRTATRNQLLSLLAPTLGLPRYELIAGSATLRKPFQVEEPDRSYKWAQQCRVDARFYLIAQSHETLTLDDNACEVVVAVPMFLQPVSIGAPKLVSTGMPNVITTGGVSRLTGAGQLSLSAEGEVPSIGDAMAEEFRLEIRLRPIGYERKVVINGNLRPLQDFNRAAGYTHAFILSRADTN